MKRCTAILAAMALTLGAYSQSIIDKWDYNVSNGGLVNALSSSELGGGGATWKNDGNASVSSQQALYTRNDDGNYFYSVTPSVLGISGAKSGEFDCEWDFVSADFANTAALDQKITWACGVRGPGNQDVMLRLMYEGQLNITNINVNGVTNIYADADHIMLMVNDKNNNWREAVTFPGSSISDLHVRINYNLFDGTADFFYTPSGGSETNFYSGELYDDWAFGDYRQAVQFLNGGSIWEAGDDLIIDNLTYTQIQEPFDPPALALIDLWTYDDNTNGAALSEGVSTGFVGGVTFNAADLCFITNNMLLFERTSTNASQDSVFRTATPSLYAGGTTGIYELAWDYTAADFSNSALSNGTGNVGMTIRDTVNGNVSMGFRLRFNGTDFILQMDDANGNSQTMATFPGSTLEDLSVRLVMNLDDAGNPGSAALLYTKDGIEIASTYNGTVHPGFVLSEYRLIAQSINGGNSWALGDKVYTDNLRFEKIAAMPVPPVYSEKVVYEMSDTIGTVLQDLDQTGTDEGQFVGTDPNMVANGLGSLVVSGDTTNDFYRIHELDTAYTSGMHRLEFAFDDWNLDATEDGSSLKFGFQDSTGLNNVIFGIDVNTNNGTVRFRAAANNGGGAGQDFYDYAGYVASTGVVLRIDANLDAGVYSAIWRYDNQTEDDFIAVVGGGSLGPLQDIAEIRLALNAGANSGMDPTDFVNVDYLKYWTTSDQTPPTPAEFYSAWLALYPGLGASTNLTDNPDGDIYDNLSEYYYGGNPTVGETINGVPALGDQLSDGGTNYILYVFNRRADQADRGLGNTIELKSNLPFGSWVNDTSLYEFVGSAELDDTWTAITNRVNAEAALRFIRNRIDYTP